MFSKFARRAAGHAARRLNSSVPRPSVSSKPFLAAAGLGAAASAALFFGTTADCATSVLIDTKTGKVKISMSDFAAPNVAAPELWASIRKDIEAIMDDENAFNPGKDNFPGNSGGGGDIGPMFVRLAWHCSGTYCKSAMNGGSDGGTMRFCPESDHGGNAGLGAARSLLEPVFEKYQGSGVTHADIYVFSGNVAIEAMGGPALPFRAGRSDASGPATPGADSRFSPDGRLPDADGRDTTPAQHIRDIFYRMGFNDREIVALSGAHGLGRCHTDRSGFWGPWTRAPTTFSNEYFRVLEEVQWDKKKTHQGGAWTGPEQYENADGGDLMMLPTDMALVWDGDFRRFVRIYKNDEDVFFKDFAAAWTKLTENGCKNLGDVIPNIATDDE